MKQEEVNDESQDHIKFANHIADMLDEFSNTEDED